jgi:predicted kinase
MRQGVPRIVIDRTNLLRRQRAEFGALARAAGYRVRILYLDVPAETCRERKRKRKDHPTLASDRVHEAMTQYTLNRNIPEPDGCDELVILTSDNHAASRNAD